MPAITWQNVQGPSLAQASAPLLAAQQGFTSAFGQLNDALKERETIENKNWDVTKSNNTAAFLDAVAKYTDPEKLKAAQGDPNSDLNQMRSQFGNQVDMDKVRGAADARALQTMQQAKEAIAYQDVMRNEKTAPLIDQYKDAVMRKSVPEMEAARAAYLAAGGRNAADLDVFADHRTRELTERTQADQKFGLDMKVGQSTIDHQRAEESIGRSNAANGAVSAQAQASMAATQGKVAAFNEKIQTDQYNGAQAAGQSAALAASLDKKGNLYSGGMANNNNLTVLMDYMKKNHLADDNSDKQGKILTAVSDLVKSGIPITDKTGQPVLDKKGQPLILRDIPMNAVTAAVGQLSDPWYNVLGHKWNNGPAADLKAALIDSLGKGAYIDKDGEVVSKVLGDLKEYTDATQGSVENAAPVRSMGPNIVQQRRK